VLPFSSPPLELASTVVTALPRGTFARRSICTGLEVMKLMNFCRWLSSSMIVYLVDTKSKVQIGFFSRF
jgi:hypothetical protein